MIEIVKTSIYMHEGKESNDTSTLLECFILYQLIGGLKVAPLFIAWLSL